MMVVMVVVMTMRHQMADYTAHAVMVVMMMVLGQSRSARHRRIGALPIVVL
jgi:hypothetical protein